ncbi:MAG: S24 family peptidase, partial [Cetobacterium sp.]
DFIERFIERFISLESEADEIRYVVAYDRTPDLIKKKLEEPRTLKDVKKTEIITLPVLGKAAAGLGHANFEDNTRMEVLTSITSIGVPKNAFMVEVSGDSMFPTLSDGDLVIINPLQKEIESIDGKVCVLNYHDQTYIKRVKVKKSEIRLISDNSDKKRYSDIIISGEDLEYLKCHGAVIESRRKH